MQSLGIINLSLLKRSLRFFFFFFCCCLIFCQFQHSVYYGNQAKIGIKVLLKHVYHKMFDKGYLRTISVKNLA